MQTHDTRPTGFQPTASAPKAKPLPPPSFEVVEPGRGSVNPFPPRPHEVWTAEPPSALPVTVPPEVQAQVEPQNQNIGLFWKEFRMNAPGTPPAPLPNIGNGGAFPAVQREPVTPEPYWYQGPPAQAAATAAPPEDAQRAEPATQAMTPPVQRQTTGEAETTQEPRGDNYNWVESHFRMNAPGTPSPPPPVRTARVAAVQRESVTPEPYWYQGPPVQAKLTVGAPNDVYEQEADRVAEQVMSMPNAAIQQPVQHGTVSIAQTKVQPNLLEILIRNAQATQIADSTAPIQPKLTVGAPNDQYEQEADRVAEQVMSTPDSATQQPVQREAVPDDDEVQTKPIAETITPLVQREAMPQDEEEPVQAKFVQREAMPQDEEEPVQTQLIQRAAMPQSEDKLHRMPLVQRVGAVGVPYEHEAEHEADLTGAKALVPAAQLAGGPEEEELLQGKFETAQLAGGPEEEELLKGTFAPVQRADAEPDRKPRENKTGMPDNLKAGVESLSGISLDNVQVHYNSAQPAQLNALAYAQGSDIHVAPGQEKHLPHEVWHIVQQAQGRVQPTMQMKDGVPVNDDAGLEREADVMGWRATHMSGIDGVQNRSLDPEPTLQRREVGLLGPAECERGEQVAWAPEPAGEGGVPGRVQASPRTTVQRYLEVNHPTEGRLQISESQEFFKPVGSERELWAEREKIEIAAGIMSLNKGGILTVSPGTSKILHGRTYHKVVVSSRQGPPIHMLLQGASAKAKSPLPAGASDPFAVMIKWLQGCDGKTIRELLTESKEMHNPFEYGSYANGAFSAIRIQLGFEINHAFERLGYSALAPIEDLLRFLTDWRDRIAKVNSEAAHQFNFMVTECGGFSKMIMPGKDKTQSQAEVGDRMRVDGLGELPGPWQNHYAAVIMTDPRGDRVTIESAAGLDEWWFGIYGNREVSQTFIAKTLIAKLKIGGLRGEKDSAACEEYAQAILHQDPEASRLGSLLNPEEKKQIDVLLNHAEEAVQDGKIQKDLDWLKNYIPAYKVIVSEMPEGDYHHKTQAQLHLDRGVVFFRAAMKEETVANKKDYISWAKSNLDKAFDHVIEDRMDRERATRYPR